MPIFLRILGYGGMTILFSAIWMDSDNKRLSTMVLVGISLLIITFAEGMIAYH